MKGTPLFFPQIRVVYVKELSENTIHKIEMDEILCYKENAVFFVYLTKYEIIHEFDLFSVTGLRRRDTIV